MDISGNKVKLNVELLLYLDYYDLIQQKDWQLESQLTETGLITGNLVQLRSNQQTLTVKIYFVCYLMMIPG